MPISIRWRCWYFAPCLASRQSRPRTPPKTQDELGELVPNECGSCPQARCDLIRLPARRPEKRETQHHETDQSVSGGLHQHRDLSRLFGIQISRRGGLGGVVDRQTRPQAEFVVAKPNPVSE